MVTGQFIVAIATEQWETAMIDALLGDTSQKKILLD